MRSWLLSSANFFRSSSRVEEAPPQGVLQRSSQSEASNFRRRNSVFTGGTESFRERERGSRRLVGDSGLQQFVRFCPALALWEVIEMQDTSQTAQHAAWSFDAALLFVDISGFTNLSTKLTVDCLQRHINRYFSALIDVIVRHNGDVLRFAGDAVLCAWCVTADASKETLTMCVRAACACALELIDKCGTYPIPELPGTSLSIHMGIGVSLLHAYRVGLPDRWELLVYGPALMQVAVAEGHAGKGEALVSPEAWELVASSYEGELCGDGCVRVTSAPGGSALEDERTVLEQQMLGEELFTRELIVAQSQSTAHLQLSRDRHEAVLKGYVHETARQAIAENALAFAAERRRVVVAFAKFDGLEACLEGGVSGLGALQACLTLAMTCIHAQGGQLRQFIADDKGVVLIWSFGLPQGSYRDNALRGLRSALEMLQAVQDYDVEQAKQWDLLRRAERSLDAARSPGCLTPAYSSSSSRQGSRMRRSVIALTSKGPTPPSRTPIKVNIGMTNGIAFCGCVGAPHRCEYSVMGPSVNLAARLMATCGSFGVDLLVDSSLRDAALDLDDVSHPDFHTFKFKAFDPVSVKGYDEKVAFYHPMEANKEAIPSLRKKISFKAVEKMILVAGIDGRSLSRGGAAKKVATPSSRKKLAFKAVKTAVLLVGKDGGRTSSRGGSQWPVAGRRVWTAVGAEHPTPLARNLSISATIGTALGRARMNTDETAQFVLDKLTLLEQMTVKIASVVHVTTRTFSRSDILGMHPEGTTTRVTNALGRLLALKILQDASSSASHPEYSFADSDVATGIYEAMMSAQASVKG